MSIKFESKDLAKVILIGDHLLIKPTTLQERTKSGLFLPPGVKEKEPVQQGYIVKIGPGYPIPAIQEAEESWKNREEVKYVPLQAKVGDLAVYMQNAGHEIFFNDEKYVILPNGALLMLIRDEDLFR